MYNNAELCDFAELTKVISHPAGTYKIYFILHDFTFGSVYLCIHSHFSALYSRVHTNIIQVFFLTMLFTAPLQTQSCIVEAVCILALLVTDKWEDCIKI